MLNFMAPKSVKVIHKKGIKGLRIQMYLDAGIMAIIMLIFAIILAIFGAKILELIFSKNDFSGYANILTVMGFATAFAASSGPIASALITARRSKQASLISILMFLSQLVIAPICIYYWGLIGAAYTILIIEIFGIAARLKLFLSFAK
jgi:O-antigen/teichoic acid export membrane protein